MHLQSISEYEKHLVATSKWCIESIKNGKGGSCGYYMPILGWSRPYPETSGYMIPTLLKLGDYFSDTHFHQAAVTLGEWLLSIQNSDGSWYGGLHPSKNPQPSIFNTGQIVKGMMSLYGETKNETWLDAAVRAANWLLRGLKHSVIWQGGDYLSNETPSYYTHVLWPMLEVWSVTGDDILHRASVDALDYLRNRILENGCIKGWGFKENQPAFTHTISYTIRGFQEASRLINDYNRYAKFVEPTLDRIVRKSELTNGRLPGAYDLNWQSHGSYVCLTGNAQLALNILFWERNQPDLRLVNAASKLVDYVKTTQTYRFPIPGMRGAVAGSDPIWGAYMKGRYPNWAAKYFCDALMDLIGRARAELESYG